MGVKFDYKSMVKQANAKIQEDAAQQCINEDPIWSQMREMYGDIVDAMTREELQQLASAAVVDTETDITVEDLKRCRSLNNMTQVQFAEKIGVPLATYVQWESGRRTPPDYALTLIAKLIKCEGSFTKMLMHSDPTRCALMQYVSDIMNDISEYLHSQHLEDVEYFENVTQTLWKCIVTVFTEFHSLIASNSMDYDTLNDMTCRLLDAPYDVVLERFEKIRHFIPESNIRDFDGFFVQPDQAKRQAADTLATVLGFKYDEDTMYWLREKGDLDYVNRTDGGQRAYSRAYDFGLFDKSGQVNMNALGL